MVTTRLSREALVFRALCVLDETCAQAREGRVAPSAGLRLALAFLYAVGDRRAEWFDRQPYDEFWRVATQEHAAIAGGHNTEGYGRSVTLTSNMNAIARAAGMPTDPPMLAALARARGALTRR